MVGNGRTVHALVRGAAIAARGHAVRLVTLGPVLSMAGIEVCTRPIPGSLPAAVRAARGFFHDLHSFRPDLLHVHYAGGKLGTLASLSRVRPLVVTVMGGDVQPEQHAGGRPALEGRATRRLLAEADLILAKSDALRREIAAHGAIDEKVHTVRWGIDPESVRRRPDEARALRSELRLRSDDQVVLSPRILRPLYNIHLLVEAWPLVLARVPRALLLISEHRADEDYRRRLDARVTALGLGERVRFVGALGHEEMPAFYTLAEVMVSVPFSDGLPQSLFEAMACETPAVVGRLAAYDEVVKDGEHALLADLEPGAIAAAVIRLLEDPALAARLTRAARERVLAVASLPREAARVEALYAELLARPRRRAALAPRLLDGATLFLR
jgi:glycosyltransferase involved in cell wall biosynthesis